MSIMGYLKIDDHQINEWGSNCKQMDKRYPIQQPVLFILQWVRSKLILVIISIWIKSEMEVNMIK